ncbi:Glyco_trans_4-like_N domain-containing protein [Gammaproteobacteria bacterium]
MKILIFLPQFLYGGAERLGVELAVDLNRKGVHADVIGMYFENYKHSLEARNELIQRGVPKVFFLGLSPNPSILGLLFGAVRLSQMVREQKYDVIETSSLSTGVIASWACRGTGVRHVVGLHRTFNRSEDYSLRFMVFLISVRLIYKAQFYVVSNYARKSWKNLNLFSTKKIYTVYNSIAPSRAISFNYRARLIRELGVDDSVRILICVARLALYKHQELVLDAVAPICVEKNLILIFVGSPDLSINGTREMLLSIENKISKNCLRERVRFLGQREDVYDLMTASDVLVHAASRESFGLVLAEAMSLGLPVVSTSVEGIPEVLAETDSILVPPGDSLALREAILTVLSRSQEEAVSACVKGKTRAMQFDQDHRTKAMVSLFKDVISGRC